MVLREETAVQLRDLWDEGFSEAEIAKRLGFSERLVHEMADKLDLKREAEHRAPRRVNGSPPIRVPLDGTDALH